MYSKKTLPQNPYLIPVMTVVMTDLFSFIARPCSPFLTSGGLTIFAIFLLFHHVPLFLLVSQKKIQFWHYDPTGCFLQGDRM